ncbi:MAG: dihydrofolate reductase [Candidatus Pacebacteria bacterium]|nr:dihydrofolate reductase [Candidatus Paceibacterota bacterium]
MISIIAAIGKNNELGKKNTLLWNMPEDMKHFRDTTRGHTVIMGQKTFESMDSKPLPNRRNIVLTQDKAFNADGIEISYSLEDTLDSFKDSEEEVFVMGGGQIYKQSMEEAGRLYITHVDMEDKDADTYFPEIVPIVWNETSHEEHKADEKNPFAYTFSVYERFF